MLTAVPFELLFKPLELRLRFNRLARALTALSAALIAGLAPASGLAATRSFVVNNFFPANYFDAGTCPQGLNPLPDVFFKRDLKILGLPQAEVETMFKKDYNMENGAAKTDWVRVVATRGNGQDNVYINPTTVPDSHLKPAVGRYAYGLNLDGRGAASPDSYEDPSTHEKGVNNQLFRAIGCIQAYKGNPPPQPPLEAEYRWDFTRAVMGAWLISITGIDLSRDGDVTVTFEQSVDRITTPDANAHVQADMTYRVSHAPLFRNTLRGKLKDGVITTEPALITMKCISYMQPTYEFRQARLRLTLKPDGSLEGVLGAYQPWYPFYWSHAKVGYIDERGFGVDTPGLYRALRRYADGYPDPKTGENTAISAAYMIEAVPAHVVTANLPPPEHAARPPAAATTRQHCGLLESCGLLVQAAHRLTDWKSEPAIPGNPAFSRRLSADQIRRVVGDAFGPSIRIEGRFEPELREDGLFAIGAGRVGVTAAGMEQYDAMARAVADQVVSERHRDTLVPCKPASSSAPDDECAARFFSLRGSLLYRRPLEPDEVRLAAAVAHTATMSLGSFYAGLGMSLAGMLESPQFIFRHELAVPDPHGSETFTLDPYSRASQLSFFLWNSGPDAELLEAARIGKLNSKAGLREQVARMLESPRLESGVRAFFTDMLQFDLFNTVSKDTKIYPKWTVKVAQDAQEQTLRTIVGVVLTDHDDYRNIFTARKTFLTPVLGSIYRVPVQQGGAPWQAYEFPDGDPHTGIQSQVSFVALHSHEGLSSPTLRGKALREILLCEPIPAPPANVNFAVAQDTNNPDFKTMRARLTAHRTDPTCAGCHKLMDPAGLSLENFEADGGYRTVENNVPLDTSGELDGIGFRDATGLGHALHENPAAGACLVRRIYSYATGRSTVRRDMPWIRYLEKAFASDGYRVPELLGSIATSENFYRVSRPPMPLVAFDSSGKGAYDELH